MSPLNRMLRLPGASLVVMGVLVASSAVADPTFPGKLESDLKMPCTPGCAVCHLDASGGPGRLRMTTNGGPGFGMTLKDFGLDITHLETLEPALQADEKGGSDIDGDGTPDTVELAKGEDPNDPTKGASVCSQGPEFGCVRVARQGPVDDVAGVASAAALALGIAAFRRRRAR